MVGSTPSNIAHKCQQLGYPVRVIAGLNLPMMLRILNYPTLSLHELTLKAISGGQEGILEPQMISDSKSPPSQQNQNPLKSTES